MPDPLPVSYTVSSGIATIQLNRPDVMNALNGQTFDHLEQSIENVRADKSVKVVQIRGSNRAFSTGVDLVYLEDILRENHLYFEFVEHFNAVLLAVENCPVPTIAVIEGYALAGGLELLLACDFAIASTQAVIGDQHANYGLLPGGGATQRLPRRVGEQRAKDLIFTGRTLDAAEAYRIGLILEIAEPENLEETLDNFTDQLVKKSRTATSFAKRAIHRGAGLPIDAALHHEAHAVAQFFTTSSSPAIGLEAFQSKQPPIFND